MWLRQLQWYSLFRQLSLNVVNVSSTSNINTLSHDVPCSWPWLSVSTSNSPNYYLEMWLAVCHFRQLSLNVVNVSSTSNVNTLSHDVPCSWPWLSVSRSNSPNYYLESMWLAVRQLSLNATWAVQVMLTPFLMMYLAHDLDSVCQRQIPQITTWEACDLQWYSLFRQLSLNVVNVSSTSNVNTLSHDVPCSWPWLSNKFPKLLLGKHVTCSHIVISDNCHWM